MKLHELFESCRVCGQTPCNCTHVKLDELSTDALAAYKKKASADATAADKRGDYKRGDKRFSGIVKATNKQFANDKKAREQKAK